MTEELWFTVFLQVVMAGLPFKFSFCVINVLAQILLNSLLSGLSWCPPPNRRQDAKFEQRTDRFWQFEKETNSWVEITFPFDLTACVNDSCTKVGSIEILRNQKSQFSVSDQENKKTHHDMVVVLPVRKRISLRRMSESSVWITGQSGSIFERFWNGVQWVIAPHELPTAAGKAVSIFIVNQTILSLSEAGMLYQLQLNENSQPIWTELTPKTETGTTASETESSISLRMKSGIATHDGEKLYISTVNGSLVEIREVQPLRWFNYGRPPGGDVSAVVDVGTIRPGVVFIVSSSGDLYEFDKRSKPSWKKHVSSEASMEHISLLPFTGCTLEGMGGAHSWSLFLLSKDGFLIERRLDKRKWKWKVHGAPEGHNLSAITPVQQHNLNEEISSLFLTTTIGTVYEYQPPKFSGMIQEGQKDEMWINHMHPQEAKVARGLPGVQLQAGRIIFQLDDGRLGELHLPGLGGEGPGPNIQMSLRRKSLNKYEWSIIDVPETEGWNAEYCTEEHGPSNCIAGIKDVLASDEPDDSSSTTTARWRKAQEYQHYLSSNIQKDSAPESNNFLSKSILTNFRMRVMHADRSFFLITESGLIFEHLYTDGVWLWLRHEYWTSMRGAVGGYNGSLFLVDVYGNLLMRERSGTELSWINCTAMRKGRQVATGPPWDGIPGKAQRVTADDALFFVNKKGRLLQFTVALRKFKWKDCHNPADTKIAFIVDQEVLRLNIVFVVGRNGRLYQYNRLTELWHRHYQSPHLVLSRSPGTAMRPSPASLTGSIFMISENGGLVEYNWNAIAGWEWVEHGTPHRDVELVGAPGPCFDGTQLFVIGSDGHVYQRHLEQRTWKWTNHAFPGTENTAVAGQMKSTAKKECSIEDMLEYETDGCYANNHNRNCNEKVAPVRPIPFSEDSVIFEIQDGRLAELRRSGTEAEWEWVRIIGTPTSPCLMNYWTAVAS